MQRIPGQGPTLVFLHHGLGSIRGWRDFPMAVCAASGLAGLIYDRCGHGLSPACACPRDTGYLHREAEVLKHLLEHYGIDDFILVGHSDGGSIALIYAALSNVVPPRAVITLAAHVFVEPVTRQGIRATVDAYLNGLRARLRKYHGVHTDRLFWEWAGCWLSPKFDSWNICQEIQAIRCPVTIIQGADDPYGTVLQMEGVAGNVGGPARSILIPNAAHDPHLEAPAATLEAVLRPLADARGSVTAPPTQSRQGC